MNSKWSEFKLRIGINSSFGEVYRAWASPAGLESWFLRKASITRPGKEGSAEKDAAGKELGSQSFAEKGDDYEWHWHGYDDSVAVKGKFLEANGTDRLSFIFAEGCPVHIRLLSECGETVVELRESTASKDEEVILRQIMGDSKGWIFYLANLKSILEGGIDLRNKKLELINVINS